MLFVIKNINSRVRVQEPITFFDLDASHDYFFFLICTFTFRYVL